MLIKLPNSIKNLYFCGDIHGNLEYIKYSIANNHLKNACIVICGDVGMGFQPKWEKHVLKYINHIIVSKNCFVVGIRGNHDNPDCFNDISIEKQNWINVPDYTIIEVCNKHVLCIGGGISIDRSFRIINETYWKNETIVYKPKIIDFKIDIIASHEAPLNVFPYGTSKIVTDFAKIDPNLLNDLLKSRETLSKVLNDYKGEIIHWYYGHYHNSFYEVVNGTTFHLLNIGELSLCQIQ